MNVQSDTQFSPKTNKTQLKILLLQIRNDPKVCKEELESFARYSGLEAEQIDIFNVFEKDDYDYKILDNYDALYVGGSSDVSVLEPEKYPFVIPCQALLRHCAEINKPVFASCFGFQLAVMAFGGEILRDQKDYEMGTIPIQISELGRSDPIFESTPNNFLAVSVHQEKALELPDCLELLAFTDKCCHAFKHKQAPFWGFQFHPEVNLEILVQRLGVYRHKYTDGDGHYESLLDGFKAVPDSNQLLAQFVERVLLSSSNDL